MTPVTKTFTFAIPEELKSGLRALKERDGLTEAEQIRRAIRMWLDAKGISVKTGRKRAATRKRP